MNKMVREHYKTAAELMAAAEKRVRETEVVLDIGCGIMPMNYFRPKLHLMVEPWKEYSDILSHRNQGDKSVVILRTGGLEALEALSDNSVDSIFLLDVIEHLEKDVGQRIIIECERVAREQIVIFTPLGFMPQHVGHGQQDGWGLGGAAVQEHRCGWEPEDFGAAWTFLVCEQFHLHDFKNELLEKPYGAFYAVRNFENKTTTQPAAMSEIRRQLPSELEAERLQKEAAELRQSNAELQAALDSANALYTHLLNTRSVRTLRAGKRLLRTLGLAG